MIICDIYEDATFNQSSTTRPSSVEKCTKKKIIKKKFLQQKNPNKIPNNYNKNSKWVKENHRHVNQLRRSNKH